MKVPKSLAKWFRLKGVPALLCAGAVLLPVLFDSIKSQAWMPEQLSTAVARLRSAVEDEVHVWGRKTVPDPRLVLVGVDESSLELDHVPDEEIAESRALQKMLDGFPWNREVFALLIERLIETGAAVVGIDFLFTGPREGDDSLAAVLLAHPDKVVFGVNMTSSDLQQDGLSVPQITLPAATIISDPALDSPQLGYVNFWPEDDGVIRQVLIRTTQQELRGYPRMSGDAVSLSLSAALLAQAGIPLPKITESGEEDLTIRFSGEDEKIFRPIPISSIFQKEVWEKNLGSGEFFRDKIVLVGPSAERFQDFHQTPVGRMLGPKLHLSATASIMAGEFVLNIGQGPALLLVLLAALFTWAIVILEKRPLLCLVWLAAAVVGWFGAAVLFFNHAGLLLPVFDPSFVILLGGTLGLGYNFALEQIDKNRVRGTLDRYVSRNVVREILDNRDDFFASLGGTRQPMTILFSDVRGFTSLSENADPVELVKQLNEYLGNMVDVVFRHNGTVDKFIGDAVMAVWGNVRSLGPAEDARNAITAALEMRGMLDALNARWREEGRPEFITGIGLNHGDAVFGNIGSQQKMEPTVIGDAVNLASRMEGLTKIYGTPILISDSAARLVLDHFILRTVDCVRVVGKQQPVDVHALVGGKGDPVPDWLETHESAILAFRARDFSGARAMFSNILELAPNDGISLDYIRRCDDFLVNPPDASWRGEQTIKQK